MQTAILASLGKALWRQATAYGLDAEAIFLEAGLDPSAIQQSQAKYPYQKLADAWLTMARLKNNLHIGLDVVDYYRPSDLHALGVAFLSSANLLNALKRLERYYAVLNPALKLSVVEHNDRVDFICEREEVDGDALIIAQDCRNALVINLARTGIGEKLDPVDVAFSYPEPATLGDHLGRFRCPLSFDAPYSRLSFSHLDSQRAFTAANRDLAMGNDQILDKILVSINEKDLVYRVKHILAEQLPSGTPSENEIAALVLMSPRTLSRRLSENNTSFRKLLTAVRHELAEGYIADPKLPITEISFLLGFSDTSSFSRAFKRWTGTTPANFREMLG